MADGRGSSFVGAILALVLTACGSVGAPDPGGGPGGGGSAATTTAGTGTRQASPTLTDPAAPENEVTDVGGVAITPEQIEALSEECKKVGGVPDTVATCVIPRELPRCTPKDRFCLRAGTTAGGSVGVLRVVDNSGQGGVCPQRAEALCRGVRAPLAVVKEVRSAATSTSPTSTAGTSSSSSPSQTPSSPSPSSSSATSPTTS